jgi:O-methyltransferase
MRAVLKACGAADRNVWVADSFEGLPPPDAERYPADADDRHFRNPRLQVTLEDVKANFEKYGLLDDHVRFLKGWVKDTLPSAPIERLAVLRLDGDMYESTWQAIDARYPKLSPGGFVIVDDYSVVEGCRKAIEDFRKAKGITERIEAIDPVAIFWRRS